MLTPASTPGTVTGTVTVTGLIVSDVQLGDLAGIGGIWWKAIGLW